MRQRLWVLIGAAAVVGIGVSAYGLSPYLAFNSLRKAANTGNRDRLEELVDFPAVRENLKSQISTGLLKSMSADPGMRDNPFAAVGALLAPVITDRMVDSVVTPDGIALALSKGTVSKSGDELRSEDPAANRPSNLEAVLSYRTVDRFHADLWRRDRPDIKLALTLERRGLFGWKLIRIDIPQSLFGATSPPSEASAEAKLTRYQLQQWGVNADPSATGTLRVNASILNATNDSLPYPLLRVTLADQSGRRIAAREFDSSVYLGALRPGLLGAGKQAKADFEFRDPGKDATNFEIDICIRGDNTQLICAGDSKMGSTAPR